MTFFTVHPFHSFNLAVVLLIAGKILTLNIDLLRRYSIPEPVAGGFLCIAVTGLLWALFDLKVSFEVGIRDFLLLVFFAGIGLKSDIRTLLAGGRPLVILLILATSFILLQNFAGMGLARLFGMEPKTGLLVGSVSLTGGVGTTLACRANRGLCDRRADCGAPDPAGRAEGGKQARSGHRRSE